MPAAPLVLLTSLPGAEEAAWRSALAAAMPGEDIVLVGDRYAPDEVEVAIVANPHPGALDRLPRLRWVQSLWAGVDRLAADPTLPDVPLVRLVDPTLARAMAETVLAVVLSLHRDLDVYAAQQWDGLWLQHPTRLAHERHICVLGLGEMGRATAGLLAQTGFAVRGWSRSGAPLAGVQVHAGDTGFEAALRGAEIVVNLLPLTAETRGILDAATFSKLPPGACLLNFGPVVVDQCGMARESGMGAVR